jgi:hypothetical protein
MQEVIGSNPIGSTIDKVWESVYNLVMKPTNTLRALALSSLIGCGSPDGSPAVLPERAEISERIIAVQEAPPEAEQERITLGNVTFLISADSQKLSPEERREFFANLEKAHEKLSEYLGEDLMTMPVEMEVPITIQLEEASENAKVVWANHTDTNNRCNIVKIELHQFLVQTLSVDVLAHEFFHLFQLHGYMESKMFVEGQTHALMALIFENPKSWEANKDRVEELSIPLHQEVLNRPWDYANCQNVMPEGPMTESMEMLIRSKHAMLWIKFEEDNPGFIKKFYAEISNLREQRDRAYFTHTDLVELASSINPNFADWYKKNIVLHPIQESKESVRILAWTPLSPERLGLFNFSINVDEGGAVSLQPTLGARTGEITSDLINGEQFQGQFPTGAPYQSVNIRKPFVDGQLVTDSRLTLDGRTVQKITPTPSPEIGR